MDLHRQSRVRNLELYSERLLEEMKRGTGTMPISCPSFTHPALLAKPPRSAVSESAPVSREPTLAHSAITLPTQVTAKEISDMKDMVVSQEYRHMSIHSLALRAQRIGKVFVSPSTWRRLIRERGWIRPRHRVYPAKPKEGIRASKPNEYWHIDVTVIKPLGGTRTYLQAVIDNFSRRILAWRLAPRLEPQTTCLVLAEAAKNLSKNGDGATVIADSGIENVNDEVDNLFGLGQLHRILAQVEVNYSNSMIEALWRSMKHGWLFLHQLDTFAALEKLIAFYVEQHNSVVPHSAFAGDARLLGFLCDFQRVATAR
jgi:putative transposase